MGSDEGNELFVLNKIADFGITSRSCREAEGVRKNDEFESHSISLNPWDLSQNQYHIESFYFLSSPLPEATTPWATLLINFRQKVEIINFNK